MTAIRRVAGAAGLAAFAAAGLFAQSGPLRPLAVVRLDRGEPVAPTDARPASGPGARLVPAVTERAGERGTPDRGRGTPVQEPVPLPPLPVVRLDDRGASATLDTVRPLSLRIAEPLPLRDVLLMLVRETGLSLVVAPGIEAAFAGELKDVSLRQAFELVLGAHGLDYAVDGTAIRVFRRRTMTRFFDVNVPRVRRSGDGVTVAASSLPGAASSGSRSAVRWQVEDDPAASLIEAIRTQLSSDGRFSFDRAAGVVQVTDYPERLDRVALYLESVERRVNRQVDIDAQVIEVTLANPGAAGVDWSSAMSAARRGTGAGAPSLDVGAFVEALRKQGDVALLASPRFRALHNEPALMRVGTEEVTFVRQPDGNDRAPHAPSPVFGGFALALTALVAADGTVTLSVAPSVSRPAGEARSPAGGRAPVMAVAEWSTAVRLRDGETLVLPGLRRDRVREETAASGGLLGLFRRPPAQTVRSELAVLLTPRVRS